MDLNLGKLDIQLLLKEKEKRERKRKKEQSKIKSHIEKLESMCLTYQLNAIKSPCKRKAILGTRRSGKTRGMAIYLIMTCLKYFNADVFYLGLTFQSCSRIMSRMVEEILQEAEISYNFNISTLKVTINGTNSKIHMLGVEKPDALTKIYGIKSPLIVMDEAGSITISEEEIEKKILPCLIDYNGTFCLSSTPENNLSTLFARIWTDKKPWEYKIKFDARDNPYIRENFLNEIEKKIKENPEVVNTAAFRQHYNGEYVIDISALVYKYNDQENVYDILPKEEYKYVIASDLGWEDATSFIVLAYHVFSKNIYVVDSFKKSKMLFEDVGEKLTELKNKYPTPYLVIDGANKQFVESLKYRYKLNLIATDKVGKHDHISLLNDDFILGRVRMRRNSDNELKTELKNLTWKYNKDKTEREENPLQDNHLCDALLYGWRYCYHYLAKEKQQDLSEQELLIKQEKDRIRKLKNNPYQRRYN